MACARLQLPTPVADCWVASAATGWVPVEVYCSLINGFVAGWAFASKGSRLLVAVYQMEGHVFRKFLHHSSPRLRTPACPKEGAQDEFFPVNLHSKPRELQPLQVARYLRKHLEIVGEIVGMSESESMCRCEMDGEKATEVMINLCGEVEDWIHNEVAGMRQGKATGGMTPEQAWLKLLKVWSHFACEHLQYMLRPGSGTLAPETQ